MTPPGQGCGFSVPDCMCAGSESAHTAAGGNANRTTTKTTGPKRSNIRLEYVSTLQPINAKITARNTPPSSVLLRERDWAPSFARASPLRNQALPKALAQEDW